MFNKKPICEICGKNEATHFSLFHDGERREYKELGKWKFVCECQEEEKQWLKIDEFFKTPTHTIDWMVHVDDKDWMNWDNFMVMLRRFRKATDSYGAN